ncbi:unnamed protein product [Ranitomeya imitator]|uniref:THAP-type domain-containing protein n=1 Tax=Ranitomeya imitator TaxID=111125 RepID=A0ABN9LXV5_9NEOB|nr:unnamed protein product [Ranitomeya imitator]
MLLSCDSDVIKVLSPDTKLSKQGTIAGLHSDAFSRGGKMPRCFVERCHNYGGKRLSIILHSFPNNLDKIKTWLRCIERGGHVVSDMEELAHRIFQGKPNNRFRVCSEHFTEQSYQPSGLRKTLRKDAVPTIFRDVPPQKCPWQKVKPALKSPQVDPSGGPHRRTCTSQQSHRQSAFRPVPMNPCVLDRQPCGPVGCGSQEGAFWSIILLLRQQVAVLSGFGGRHCSHVFQAYAVSGVAAVIARSIVSTPRHFISSLYTDALAVAQSAKTCLQQLVAVY